MPNLTPEETRAEFNKLSAALRGAQFAAIRWQRLPAGACPEERLRAADAFLAHAWAWQVALSGTRLSAKHVHLLLEPHHDSIQQAILMHERGNAASAKQTAANLAELEADAERQGQFLLDALAGGGLPAGTVGAWGRAVTLARAWRQAAIAAEMLTERLMNPLHAASLHELRKHFMDGAEKAEEALRMFFQEVEQGRLPCHETLREWEERFGYACRNLRVLMRRLDPDRLALLHQAVILYRKDTAPEDRWATARAFVAKLPPHLRNHEAWGELCRRAEEQGKTPEAVLADMLFPEGAMLAANGADEPRTVRMGKDWIVDAGGEKALVAPALDMSAGDFVRWLRQEVYAMAEDILMEPFTDGDLLADAAPGLDPNLEPDGAPHAEPPAVEERIDDLFATLLEEATDEEHRLLRCATPEWTQRLRMALALLRDATVEEGREALQALGIEVATIRKWRQRLREKAGKA